ncbi:MAG TPA: GMC family oxidoreductase [Myxococcota bacterium]|nr:GMC family oxidoreductase [Myxococcota bacterium]
MRGSPSDQTLRADAVVIGTGAGGAPVAARLAEAGFDVVLLDAGPRLEPAQLTGDEGEMSARLYTMSVARGSGLSLYAGVCVGGSTLINDALCWRPPPEVLASWRENYGLDALTDAAFAPHVNRAWSDVNASPTGPEHLNRNARRLELGAARLGWIGEAMPRSVRGCANLGLCNLGCPSGAKQSTARTYVPRAEAAGARILPDTRVDRIEIKDGRAKAVLARRFDPATRLPMQTLRIEAPLVCVAAGVLGTPALLLRSGLACFAAGAGAGVQLHTSLHVTARFSDPVYGYYGPTMAYAVSEFSDVNGRAGPGFMLENTAVHPIATASALPGFGKEHARLLSELPFLARALVVLRDRTRGRVRLGETGEPLLTYTLGDQDLTRLRDGMVAIARAYLAAGALEVYLPLNGSAPVRTESELARSAPEPLDPGRASLLYAVHLFGGARMARGPERGACDQEGRLFGVKGVVVSDASSLPSNTGVNPQITILANALRIADAVVARGTSNLGHM